MERRWPSQKAPSLLGFLLMMILLFIVLSRTKLRTPLEGTYLQAATALD